MAGQETAVKKLMKKMKRRVTLEKLASLRCTDPVPAMVTSWDLEAQVTAIAEELPARPSPSSASEEFFA